MAFQSPAPQASVNPQILPLQMASGSSFGRYNKISNAQTWNMLVSDGALIDYAGYKYVYEPALSVTGVGRGIYSSSNAKVMIVVIGSAMYVIDDQLEVRNRGTLQTSSGDVFIAENNVDQIAITDGAYLYIYNTLTGVFLQSLPSPEPPALLPDGYFFGPFLKPGYVSYHNGRFIIADLESQNWWLSGVDTGVGYNNVPGSGGTQWSLTDIYNQAYENAITLKPDTIQAVVPIAGSGDNVAVFGHTVMELWQTVNNATFPYQRASSFNVDYGCLNASSIASLDHYVVWLSANEQGGATLMRISGAGAREESISTDGIDFKLANISDPTNCTGFLMRQDGHLIYQFTFPTDNISYIYDFNTKQFFNVSDENKNYHIARNVVFFNNDYYFVSLNDGNVYTFGTQFSNLQYSSRNIKQMPRIRICPPIRLANQNMFICKSISFTIENGQPNHQEISYVQQYLVAQNGHSLITQDGHSLITQQSEEDPVLGEYTECIDLRVSRDGGETFSSAIRYYMNPTGQRKSRLNFQRIGQQNDLTIMIQFIGFQRFIALDGQVEAFT